MKAIIMAGGEGRRLRPVTGETPKPLARLLGRPMIEHIILLLRKHGVTDICVTLGYKAGDIRSALGDGSRLGVRLCYKTEDRPLGTAGGVRACRDFYGGDDFLVISGDAACDLDLSALAEFHRSAGADVTMALYQDPEPLGYGLVLADARHRVTGFIEKPGWERVVTDLVNTGIYVVSPKAMEPVPEGVPFDFAKDLFPAMLRRNMKLYAVQLDGYWCDIGTPEAYYRCCLDALHGKLKLESPWGGDIPEEKKPEIPRKRHRMVNVYEYSCGNRAGLMREMSRYLAEFGADLSDGINLSGEQGRVHISPSASKSSIVIEGDSDADMKRMAELAGQLETRFLKEK